jgi:hypothetical protein
MISTWCGPLVAALVMAGTLLPAPPGAAAKPATAGPATAGPTVVVGSAAAGAAAARSTTARPAGRTTAATDSESPVPVTLSRTPPVGRRLSSDQVLAIAEALPKMKAVRANYKGSYGGAYLKGPSRWQVSFFSWGGSKEIGQVIIADSSGKVLEQWTGWQVAWTMARGYPGAFGRHVNALYIWLPLCLLFLLPFARPPWTLLHLDLLVLLSFSVSLAYFNHAHIEASVPLAYPPLLYLLARMLWLLRRPRQMGGSAPAPRPVRLLVPVPWLALGVVFLIGFRVALNVTDSNVIDVGYAGVIGAEKVVHGDPLYGGWPSDNEHGDTYGPAAYEAYVPFEQTFGWSGTWDDLPAAHAAAVVFDLLALGLMFWLGLRLRGPTLGVVLAYAWAAYPFTLFALESNSNDTLVAVFVLAALLCAGSAPARGVFAALAGLTKLAPLALAPVLAVHGVFSKTASKRARAHARATTTFLLAFVITVALVAIPALTHDSLKTIYERTLEYQANRAAPFSVWGLYGWHTAETVVEALAVALALALAVIPRRDDVIGLAAACAAILIAAQLGIEYWFYLYIPWFFPLVAVALFGVRFAAEAHPAREPVSGADWPLWPAAPAPAGASGSARLRLPSAAWPHN